MADLVMGVRRNDLTAGISVLVISSTGYNEIPSEPTVIVVPVFDTEPDTGSGVDLGDSWAAAGRHQAWSPTCRRPG